jgi:hypothetical protein
VRACQATYAYNSNPSKLRLDESFEEDVVDKEIKEIPKGFLRVASIFTECVWVGVGVGGWVGGWVGG